MCVLKFTILLRAILVFVVVFLFAAFLLRPAGNAAAGKAAAGKAAARKAVVVELFTSEGCSSCPPADELLSRLRQNGNVNGVEIIPLGFHVDYWNSLGWQDRFSSADYSRRQQQYAQKLDLDGAYTPQMVVDGAAEFVGSSAAKARDAIAQAALRPQLAEIEISAGQDKLLVRVKAPGMAQGGAVLLAITEDNLTSKVGAGENDGRVLHHAAVVRDLRQIGQIHDGSFAASLPLNLGKDWKLQDLRVVVFVQEAASGKIQGAASAAATSLLTRAR